ncbi:MAG: DUF262 domain-containing protein [Roseomonas mucosa]|nr:DUF262 domain-containing protein [Roseomonas mucosa]
MTEKPVIPRPWFQASPSPVPVRTVVMQSPLRQARPDLGERQLGPFVLPPFQRPPVWSRAQQVRLIESLWGNLPIGAYVVNQTTLDGGTDGWLLDGQQRVTAILAYAAGEFPVFGHRFPDLPLVEQRGFLMKPINSYVTNQTDAAACQDIYDRLAYGGTPHEPVGNRVNWPVHAAQWHREQAAADIPLPTRKDGTLDVATGDTESPAQIRDRLREWHTIQAHKLSRMASDMPRPAGDWLPMSMAPWEPLNGLGHGPEIILLGGFTDGKTGKPSVRTGHWKGLRTNDWCDTALGRCPQQPIAWMPKPTPPDDLDGLFIGGERGERTE